LRAISIFCMMLLLVSVHCRAKCVAVPHDTAKHSPECPLHKQKVPDSQKCTHAPQWDLDDAKQFVAITEDTTLPVAPLATLAILSNQNPPEAFFEHRIPLTLRI
jgi:hypothetical protein